MQLPKVITFPLFISLVTCGCVQAELLRENIPGRKTFALRAGQVCWCGLLAWTCACAAPDILTSSALFFAPQLWFFSFHLIVRFNGVPLLARGKIPLSLRKGWEAITSCQILRTVVWQSPWRPLKCQMFCFHNKVSCPFLPGKTTNEAQNQLEVPSEGGVCTCSVAQFQMVQMLLSRMCPDLAHVCFSSLFTATLPIQLTFDFPYWESKHTPDTHTHTQNEAKKEWWQILQGFSKDFYSKSRFFFPAS